SRTLVASITLPEATYRTTADARRFYERALARAAALPGVDAAGVVNALPLGGGGARIRGDLSVEGRKVAEGAGWANKIVVGGDYFRAIGIPLVRGRSIDQRDSAADGLVISATLARRLFRNEDAIGKRLNIGLTSGPWREIVGIVGDVRQD